MRVAVASQNFRTVTGHAGRTRRFILYEAGPDGEPEEVKRLDLPREMAFHEFHEDGPHPIDAADVLVTAGCGADFKVRMGRRGIKVVETGLTDPRQAAAAVLKGEPLPPPEQGTVQPRSGRGGHAHAHSHRHHHGKGEP